jgi:signal transduction histidine kinase
MNILKYIFLLVSISLSALESYAQNPGSEAAKIKWKADSLQNELIRYEVQKKELGSNAVEMMDTALIKILGKLSYLYFNNDYNKSLTYAQRQLVLSEQLDYQAGIAGACSRLSMIMEEKGDVAAALKYHQRCLEIKEKTGDRQGVGDCYGNIGVLYSKQANYSEALNYGLKALEIAIELKDDFGMYGNYNNIGVIYMTQNNYGEALKNFFRCLKLAEKMEDSSGICVIYENIGQIYLLQSDFDKAMNYFQASLQIANIIGDKQTSANCYNSIGIVDMHKLNYPEALKNHFIALKLREDMDDRHGIAASQVDIGTVYFRQGKNQKAISHLNKGLALAKTIGGLEAIKQAYQYLAEIYKSTKEYKLAYQNYFLFRQTNDSIYNSANEKKMTQLEMEYDFKKARDSVKAEQDKKDALAKSRSENQKTVRNYIYSGMTIAVIFLVIVLIQRSRIAKVRRQQALEQERTRISKDLHDDLGSGLTSILMMSEQMQVSSGKELVNNNIEKIKDSSRQMVDQMGEIVWAMNSKNDTLENLVGYINAYAREYFENSNISQHIHLPESIPDTTMTGMIRRNVFLVVKESLNNIIKHAHATYVNLHMNIDDNKMNITLTDNGKGFEMVHTRRFGNGLKNMHSRMAEIKGSFKIESALQRGTKTVISFPLA